MRCQLLKVTVLLLLAAPLLFALAPGCGPHSSASTTNSSVSGSNASPSAGAAPDTVHATATGRRYHREGCSSLTKSDIPMTRQEAEAKGLTPCKVCKP